MMKKLALIYLIIFGIIFPVFSQQPKTLTKAEVTALYNKLYLTSSVDSIEWNGNVGKCLCGKIDEEIYVKAEKRFNFFRLVNGLNKVTINEDFNKNAQSAALLLKANNELTHSPTSDMKCYSNSASIGCQQSCIGFTNYKYFPATSFLTGYIVDNGASNYYVGHRKWMLYTKLKEFGFGATDNTDALLTVGGTSHSVESTRDYIAYPWKGYVPIDLIFTKWSFSIPQNKEVDYSRTTILMLDANGSKIELEKLKLYENYLDHTIVWRATGLYSESDNSYGTKTIDEQKYLDKRIKVFIKNVKVDGKTMNYEYFVEPFKI